MLVYQLKVIELGECLEPVFKTKENALLIKEKYKTRNIIIKEHYLENVKNDTVYRIKTEDNEGYILEAELYSSYNEALSSIRNNHQCVIESRLC